MEIKFHKRYALNTVVSLIVYAEHLAATNLEKNRGEIKQILDLMELLATFHGIEGIEDDSPGRIYEKYLKTVQELLEGKAIPNQSKFNDTHQYIICHGLAIFCAELEGEQDHVYEPQIQFCKELSSKMSTYLMEEEETYNMELKGWYPE